MLRKSYYLGRFLGLEHRTLGSAFIGCLLFWFLMAAAAVQLFDKPPLNAAGLGFAAAVLHWSGELIHQFGHARAAARAGAPMQGVRYWFILGFSVYPENEPELPPAVHIRRALGGPIASFMVLLVSGLLLLVLRPLESSADLLVGFVFLDHLFIYFGGAMLPLGYTDGSTVLRYLRK